jgi:uncharacterized protein
MKSTMQGSYLRFYVTERHRLHGMPLWKWLLREGHALNVRGGSAFHAMAGFGHQHMMHEDRFIELGGSLIVEVEFIVTPDERNALLERVATEKVRVFYAEIPARFYEITPQPAGPGNA